MDSRVARWRSEIEAAINGLSKSGKARLFLLLLSAGGRQQVCVCHGSLPPAGMSGYFYGPYF